MNPILRASTASLLTVMVSSMSVITGCKSSNPNPTPSPDAAQSASQSAAPIVNPTAGPSSPQMSIDDLVAPIALYPDQLLAQILTASTNAQEVLDGGNWLLQNQNLKGDAVTNAAKQAGFSPSMQYLVGFPQVVDNMCQQIDWTSGLGQAFQADPKGVMDAIQRKRMQAQQTGNLKSSPQMTVDTKKADTGQQYVEIKPADPQVVYVPQYNPVTIYNTPAPTTVVVTQPAATTTTTTTQASSGVSTGSAVAIGLLSFGVGMAIGSAMHHDDYYPYPAWGYGGVYHGGHPYYPPPYRPAYPGYHPANGYHPPSNYQWNQYNKNVNVNVNNNYYGKFNSNTVNTRNPNVNNINANNRPGAGNQPNNWKGQSTYQGARPNTAKQSPGSSMANANPANRANAGNNAAAVNRPNGGNNAATNRPNFASNPGANNMNRPNTANAGATNRPNAANPGTMNRTAAPSSMNRGGDRGYSSASARPNGGSAQAARPAPQAQNRGGGSNSAFGSGGSAKSERTASSRGQASMGGGGSRGRAH